MYKKMLIVLTIGCLLLGMATRAEAENVEEQAVSDTAVDSVAFDVEDTDTNTDYKISATIVSKVTQGDTITNVIYGETEMEVSKARSLGIEGLEQKRADEMVKVKYPKVVITGNNKIITKYNQNLIESIKFFNKRGELKKEVSVQRYIPKKQSPGNVVISNNKKYLAINTPIKENEKGTWKTNTVVFNSDGDSLWSFKHNLVAIYLPPNGEYLIGEPWEGMSIYLYGKNGKILKKIKKDDQAGDFAFSEDGSYFALLVGRIDWEKENKRQGSHEYSDLVVIDAQGDELWREERIAKGSASPGEVKISNDTIIVMTGWNEFKVYYFDMKGNLLKTEQADLKRAREFKD